MNGLLTVLVVVVGLALSVRVVQQFERGMLFRLGRVVGVLIEAPTRRPNASAAHRC